MSNILDHGKRTVTQYCNFIRLIWQERSKAISNYIMFGIARWPCTIRIKRSFHNLGRARWKIKVELTTFMKLFCYFHNLEISIPCEGGK